MDQLQHDSRETEEMKRDEERGVESAKPGEMPAIRPPENDVAFCVHGERAQGKPPSASGKAGL